MPKFLLRFLPFALVLAALVGVPALRASQSAKLQAADRLKSPYWRVDASGAFRACINT
jgi:hypothetical protein